MLTVRGIAGLKARGNYHDEKGLYLQVAKSGARGWAFRFQFRGDRREMGLGSIDLVSLAEARVAVQEARKLIRAGVDPIEARRGNVAAAIAAAATSKSFDECAAMYLAANRAGWRNADHAQQWQNSVARYVSPVIGGLSVAAIDAPLVISVLEPIWSTKPETANRVRQRIEAVLNFAATRGHRPAGDNPARWQGHLEHVFQKRPAKVHHEALGYPELPAFMATLAGRSEPGARALAFAILTAARSGEVLGARWAEFNLAERVWIVPAERMKAHKEHRVPLSDAAIALLGEPGEAGERVFELSRNAMLGALKATGANVTVHGFRSTFRDWAAERTNYAREVAEQALAHTLESKVEAAYRRGDLFEKRALLMRDWARFCMTPAAESVGEVVAIRA